MCASWAIGRQILWRGSQEYRQRLRSRNRFLHQTEDALNTRGRRSQVLLCDFLVGISDADLLTVLRATLFQVENTTDRAIDWNVHYYFTAFAGWSELASLAVNGQLVRADSQTGSAFAMLSLPAHQVSNIIAVAGSGSPAGNMRSNELGFYNNSLDLPGGLRFVDQLLDVRPVPEPEAYAMLLAGLGLMGVVARRQGSDWPVWSTHDACDEPLLDGSETGLRTDALMSPAPCQWAIIASPKPSGEWTWLVIAMMTISRRAAL